MGLFNKLFKKNKDMEEMKNAVQEAVQKPEITEEVTKVTQDTAADETQDIAEEAPAPGWDAITEAFEGLYPGQTNPKHYGVLVKWIFGGNDPLDGISIYDGGDYWHFVTYGLSEIYEKETDNPEISGYGMEFTLKLKKAGLEDEEAEIRGICGILQTIARMTFNSGELFLPMEYLYTGQTSGMDVRQKSAITGFITVPETKLAGIDTSNGKVLFVEFIGMTNAELLCIKNKDCTVEDMYKKLGHDLTDYTRASII